jgi:hypothetical protein
MGFSSEALRVSELAGQHPNASTFVTFSRPYNNTPEVWTWRVNISEIAIPDDLADLGQPFASFSENLHAANVQFQVDWPSEDDTLQAFLTKRHMSVEFVTMIKHLPFNVTDKYDLQNDAQDGNCANVLGQTCVDSITEMASVYPSTMNWENRVGCKDTLLVQPLPGRGHSRERALVSLRQRSTTLDVSLTFNIGFQPDVNASESSKLYGGKSLWYVAAERSAYETLLILDLSIRRYHTSKNCTEGNTTELESAKTALYVLVMSFKRMNSYGDYIAETNGASLLCAMAGKRKDDVDQSTATVFRQSVAAVIILAALSALFVMW